MEKTDSFAILDINIGDKDNENAETGIGNNHDDPKKNLPFTTVIKIRKCNSYLYIVINQSIKYR